MIAPPQLAPAGKADEHQLSRSYLLRHHSPPSLRSRFWTRTNHGISRIGMGRMRISGQPFGITVASRFLLPPSQREDLFPYLPARPSHQPQTLLSAYGGLEIREGARNLVLRGLVAATRSSEHCDKIRIPNVRAGEVEERIQVCLDPLIPYAVGNGGAEKFARASAPSL